MKKDVSIEYLSTILKLNENTGVLTWRSRPREHFKNQQVFVGWNTRYADKTAGYERPDGYRIVRFDGQRFLYHRIVYAIHHGMNIQDLPRFIDHIDNNQRNNIPANLRPAEHAQNLYNISAHIDNTSGFKGVSWEARYKHWEARIRANGQRYHLGYFDSPEDAHAAYAAAANDLHGEFARTA